MPHPTEFDWAGLLLVHLGYLLIIYCWLIQYSKWHSIDGYVWVVCHVAQTVRFIKAVANNQLFFFNLFLTSNWLLLDH